jgi:hypothetical protein
LGKRYMIDRLDIFHHDLDSVMITLVDPGHFNSESHIYLAYHA